MQCKQIIAQLDGYRTGELPGAVRDRIAAHIGRCASCASALAGLERLATQARTLRLRPPAGIAARVAGATGDRYGAVDTDLGRVWVGFNHEGITMVHLGPENGAAFERVFERRLGRHPHPGKVPAPYARAVQAATQGEKIPLPPVSLHGLPAFEQEVLRILARIPHGEVRPYGWLAREAGNPKAARAVGAVMARNPVPLLLPCHRVVPSTGGVGNYGFGSPMKRELLRREGVSPDDLEAWAKQRVRYVGSRTTGIYCFPTCRDARRIARENRVTFSTAGEADTHGYRPCQHCRPMTGRGQTAGRAKKAGRRFHDTFA